MLAGIISIEEYQTYLAFQQHANEDPVLKELLAKIAEQTKELQRLRAEANAAREKILEADPKVMAIRSKIMAALRPHANAGPVIQPMPVKSN